MSFFLLHDNFEFPYQTFKYRKGNVFSHLPVFFSFSIDLEFGESTMYKCSWAKNDSEVN